MGIKRIAAGRIWLLSLLLLLGACGGNAGPGNTDLAAVPAGLQDAELPALTQLDAFHRVSLVGPIGVDPLLYLQSGGTVTDQAPDLLLDSDSGSLSWAMYSVSVPGKQAISLSMSFSNPNEPGAWIGLASFGSGRWEFQPMFTASPAELTLSPASRPEFISPLENFYFLVLSYDNVDVVISELTVDTDAPPPPTFTISGQVTDGISPLQGILIGLNPGGASTSTDASGNYSFGSLEAGSYTITPTDAGYTFDPLSLSPTLVDADLTGQSFVGTPVQAAVTYIADIAPLLAGDTGEKKCTSCHGGIPPNLETYAQVKSNANAVKSAVNKNDGWMPQGGSKWSQANLDLFQAWIDDGLLE